MIVATVFFKKKTLKRLGHHPALPLMRRRRNRTNTPLSHPTPLTSHSHSPTVSERSSLSTHVPCSLPPAGTIVDAHTLSSSHWSAHEWREREKSAPPPCKTEAIWRGELLMSWRGEILRPGERSCCNLERRGERAKREAGDEGRDLDLEDFLVIF